MDPAQCRSIHNDVSEHIIEVKDLKKTYPGNVEAVRGVSFSVRAGEFFGFLGPNGAGKTTTINMLVNLVKRTSGDITIDGLRLEQKPNEIYSRIGFAMQEVGLDETATAREMLELHGRLYHLPQERIQSQIDKLLKLVELEKVADRFTHTYSGGMRRRFDLALSLIHEPKILFLDEPTQGLDPHARQLIWNHLRELNKAGMTVFLTTHFMEEAEALCDRIAIMDKGQIVTEGTVPELLAKHAAKNLEDVFLKTTGSNLGEEEVNSNAADPYSRSRM
jgi:ABC-2 type transport system ATP-binding protein